MATYLRGTEAEGVAFVARGGTDVTLVDGRLEGIEKNSAGKPIGSPVPELVPTSSSGLLVSTTGGKDMSERVSDE